MNKVILGDCLDELKKLEDNSVDLLCTDPPYGYSFMGKNWDKAVPSVDIWKECLRVLKPGAFAFVMSAPRQDVLSQMIVRIGEAGFDTDYTSIYWTYASGFPKAMNIGKAVDKRKGVERRVLGPAIRHGGGNSQIMKGDYNPPKTEGNSPLEGSYGGFQPKPAVEVIIVAMKPLSEKTYVDQALKNGKGISWLDDCRVPGQPQAFGNPTTGFHDSLGRNTVKRQQNGTEHMDKGGRFPANLLISDDVLNDGRVFKTHGDKGGTFDLHGWMGTNMQREPLTKDSGSYSRYFDLDAWANTLPFLMVAKASKREKNDGLGHLQEKPAGGMVGRGGSPENRNGMFKDRTTAMQNAHPTVKPLKLMAYLITLGSREGDVVLDPFAGSCTTALAAKNLKRNYIAIEREAEYVGICEARLDEIQLSLI